MTPNGVFLFRTGFCRLIQLVLEAGHNILSSLLRIIQKKCFDLVVLAFLRVHWVQVRFLA